MSPKDVKKALSHLKRDKKLLNVIKRSPKPTFKTNKKYFESLVRSIIYQQLSGKSAGSILRRFNDLFGKDKATPEKVLKLTDAQFKSAGVSPQKMNYLRDLSTKFINGTVNTSRFQKMTDNDIKEHLISVKGIGPWTADMFLMFTLCRIDVLPTGDLGIQKGFQKIFNLKKLPDAKKMEKLATEWIPYRTIASWYLWRIADGDTENSDW